MEYAPAPVPGELLAGYRSAGFHTDAVVPRLLERNVFEFGSSVAVIDESREVTWRELADAARRVAGLLHAHGIGPGDSVVWQLPNWWEALAVAHGVWAAGAISVPVVPIYREHELTEIMRAVRPASVIGPPEFRGHDHVEVVAGSVSFHRLFKTGDDVAVAEQERQRVTLPRVLKLDAVGITKPVMKTHDLVFLGLH